ncbi:MAG: site-specific integrase [Bacillota bacterium]|nr:site-specific integrase [Bacillota bacterium]
MAKRKRSPAALNSYEQIDLLKQPNPRAPTGLRNLCIIVLMLKAGLRVNEIINLQKDDFNWDKRVLNIKRSGAASARVLKIGIEELELLKRWRDKLTFDTKYFFTTLDGKQLKDRYIREMVKRMARKAGLDKDVYPHLLRHTFAVDFIRETRDIQLLQKALGHRDLSATQNYARLLLNELNIPYNGNIEEERSGFPVDYADEGNQKDESDSMPEIFAEQKNKTGEKKLNDNMEKQLSVFNGDNNEKLLRPELIKDSYFVKAEYQRTDQQLDNRIKNKQEETNNEPGKGCHDTEEVKGTAPVMTASEKQRKELQEDVTGKSMETDKGERVRIPPIKCCCCNYILRFRGDCPQCGASFESIINHWGKQIL